MLCFGNNFGRERNSAQNFMQNIFIFVSGNTVQWQFCLTFYIQYVSDSITFSCGVWWWWWALCPHFNTVSSFLKIFSLFFPLFDIPEWEAHHSGESKDSAKQVEADIIGVCHIYKSTCLGKNNREIYIRDYDSPQTVLKSLVFSFNFNIKIAKVEKFQL